MQSSFRWATPSPSQSGSRLTVWRDMLITLHTTHYTLHTTHYTLNTTHYTLHTTHYKLHTTQRTEDRGQSTDDRGQRTEERGQRISSWFYVYLFKHWVSFWKDCEVEIVVVKVETVNVSFKAWIWTLQTVLFPLKLKLKCRDHHVSLHSKELIRIMVYDSKD